MPGRTDSAICESTRTVSAAPQIPGRRILALKTTSPSHGWVGARIHVNVANPFEVAENGDSAFGENTLDQSPPAPGHDKIDVVGHGEQDTNGRPVAGGYLLDASGRKVGARQPFAQTLEDCRRRTEALATTAQNDGITRF